MLSSKHAQECIHGRGRNRQTSFRILSLRSSEMNCREISCLPAKLLSMQCQNYGKRSLKCTSFTGWCSSNAERGALYPVWVVMIGRKERQGSPTCRISIPDVELKCSAVLCDHVPRAPKCLLAIQILLSNDPLQGVLSRYLELFLTGAGCNNCQLLSQLQALRIGCALRSSHHQGSRGYTPQISRG